MDAEGALTTWYEERKQQLEASLATTIRNGNTVNTRSPLKMFLRDWGLWLLQMIPSFKRWIELGPRLDGRMQYKYQDRMAFVPGMEGGAMFSQSYCVQLGDTATKHHVRFTDDVIFSKSKIGLFQIVVLMDNNISRPAAYEKTVQGLDRISPRLYPAEASFFIHRELANTLDIDALALSQMVFRTATAKEFAESPLCEGRPYPRGYREDDMWHGACGKRFIILRSDRFVFAACNTRQELELAAERLDELFPV